MSSRENVVGSLGAAIFLFALAAFFWFAQVDWVARPAVIPALAPARNFSAARAENVLARILGPERPHPVSTPEDIAMRGRIMKELASLGIPARIYSGFACNAEERYGLLSCATVNDVIGEIGPGEGKAILLMAHYDSVPAGPGAADDASSVAAIIESARALRTDRQQFRHPILALFTDGEEAGMIGAAAFLHDPRLRARVGAVINAEARGNHGRSLLFETSAGNGRLIDLYAHSLAKYAASSLYEEIYRFLPNDTDLTLFIRDGFPSFNLAFTENVAQYHTALDTRANLDPQSVQQQGDNILELARGLEQTDFAQLKGADEIYVDLLGRAFLHIPKQLAFPLSLAAFLMLSAAACLARGEPIGTKAWAAAFAITPALVLGAAIAGLLLYVLAQYLSGTPDPSYAHPTVLRLAFASAIGALTLLVARFAPPRAVAAACWLWMAGLGILVALLLPGFAPYFLIPSCITAVLFFVAALLPGGWEGTAGQGIILFSAAPALLLWVGLGAEGETVMGLKLHPLVTIPIALGLTTLVPLFAARRLPRFGGAVAAILALAAIALAMLAGREPAFTASAPQRLNITYVENGGHARWAADALSPIPESMRAVADFTIKPQRLSPFAWSSLYLAPAGVARDPSPVAHLLTNQRTRDGWHVTIAVQGSSRAQQMFLVLGKPHGLKAIDVNDCHFAVPPEWASRDRVVIACMSRDCAAMRLGFALTSPAPLDVVFGEQRFGLPPAAGLLLAARPKTAVTSQNGDGVLLLNRLRIPPA
jgi:hypothetical protein